MVNFRVNPLLRVSANNLAIWAMINWGKRISASHYKESNFQRSLDSLSNTGPLGPPVSFSRPGKNQVDDDTGKNQVDDDTVVTKPLRGLRNMDFKWKCHIFISSWLKLR